MFLNNIKKVFFVSLILSLLITTTTLYYLNFPNMLPLPNTITKFQSNPSPDVQYCVMPDFKYNDSLALVYLLKSKKKLRNRFDSCPLDPRAINKLNGYFNVTDMSTNQTESYKIKISTELMEVNEPNCSVQRFWKKTDQSETNTEIIYGTLIFLERENNYTKIVNDSGFYEIRCLNNSSDVFFFIDLFTILPYNMSNLKSTHSSVIANLYLISNNVPKCLRKFTFLK